MCTKPASKSISWTHTGREREIESERECPSPWNGNTRWHLVCSGLALTLTPLAAMRIILHCPWHPSSKMPRTGLHVNRSQGQPEWEWRVESVSSWWEWICSASFRLHFTIFYANSAHNYCRCWRRLFGCIIATINLPAPKTWTATTVAACSRFPCRSFSRTLRLGVF